MFSEQTYDKIIYIYDVIIGKCDMAISQNIGTFVGPCIDCFINMHILNMWL